MTAVGPRKARRPTAGIPASRVEASSAAGRGPSADGGEWDGPALRLGPGVPNRRRKGQCHRILESSIQSPSPVSASARNAKSRARGGRQRYGRRRGPGGQRVGMRLMWAHCAFLAGVADSSEAACAAFIGVGGSSGSGGWR